MSNVASKELCEELYDLSLWIAPQNHPDATKGYYGTGYDLGYLLRKIPGGVRVQHMTKHIWSASIVGNVVAHLVNGDTPEDAACKLAIELFKQGVLTKESAA